MSVPDVSGAAIANLEVETLQHKHPTFHGDTIYAETRVLDVQESTSKDDRGIVTVETKGFNQDGEEVCYFRRKVMVWKRDAAPAPAAPLRRADVWELSRGPGVDEPTLSAAPAHWGAGAAGRDLPWRRTRDPWAVLVSEIMLQQTQVDAGRAALRAFLARFPTPAACAAAPLGDVLRALERASATTGGPCNLHGRGADGRRDPAAASRRSVEALQRLPGIGPYTARAVLAFAFERRRRRRRHQRRSRPGPLARAAAPARRAPRRAPTRRCPPATAGRGTRP